MNKTLATASLICALALASCGSNPQPVTSGGNPPVKTPAVPAPGESRNKAQQLLSSWAFTYTIKSTFSDSLRLDAIIEESKQPGEYFAAGYDIAGNVSVGWYDFKYQTYVVTTGSTSLTKFFEFPGIAADNSVSGMAWFAFGDGTYSDDYRMTGKRNLSGASVGGNTMNAPLNTEMAEQLFEAARASWERSNR